MTPPFLAKLLGGPAKEIIGSIGNVIDSLHTSGEEKAAAKLKLLELENQFHVEVIKLEGEFAATQASVIKAEAESHSWLARNWRPILMLTFTYIIAHNYIFAPMFAVRSVQIPEQMWTLLNIGIGGYVGGRTVEKVAREWHPKARGT